jgi:hypothetical protein
MLCLRAFVPAGFMLAPVDGALQVVLCDADASAMPHQHGDHEHAGHHTGHHPHAQLDPTCPYAQSSGPAPLPVLPYVHSGPERTLFILPVQIEQRHDQFGPARRQFPRGPPRFA